MFISRPEHELNQEMHVCFFTLLRDIICSTQDQRMALPSLTAKLQAWQESPISPLNDWFGLSPSWVDHLVSAINFLSGDFPGKLLSHIQSSCKLLHSTFEDSNCREKLEKSMK